MSHIYREYFLMSFIFQHYYTKALYTHKLVSLKPNIERKNENNLIAKKRWWWWCCCCYDEEKSFLWWIWIFHTYSHDNGNIFYLMMSKHWVIDIQHKREDFKLISLNIQVRRVFYWWKLNPFLLENFGKLTIFSILLRLNCTFELKQRKILRIFIKIQHSGRRNIALENRKRRWNVVKFEIENKWKSHCTDFGLGNQLIKRLLSRISKILPSEFLWNERKTISHS